MTEEEFLKQLQAFPYEHRGGMTLRDYFAAKAMQGIIAGWALNTMPPGKETAEAAYAYANAMLRAREA